MTTKRPTIIVDLIEQKPLSRPIFDETYGVTDDRGDAAYRDYLARFQPWRVIVLSGDNQKVLFRSSERYFNEADARHAAELAFGRRSDIYLRKVQDGVVTHEMLRAAAP